MSASVEGNLSFRQLDGDPLGAQSIGPNIIHVGGDDPRWHVSERPSWIAVRPLAGTDAMDIVVSFNGQELPLGNHTGVIEIVDDNRDRTFRFPVSYERRTARLTVDVSTLAFELNASTPANALERTFGISDEFGGVVPTSGIPWTATVDQPWLELTATVGSTSPSEQIVARLNRDHANLIGTGQHDAVITLAYTDSAGEARSAQIPATLAVRLPVARAVTPYSIAPNTPATVRVRGEDIRAEDLAALTIDGISTANVTRVDPSRLTLNVPALPSGAYRIQFANEAGLTRSAATLVVGNAAPIGEGVIESPNVKRIIFDEQRGMILAVDRTQFQVESYTWSGTAWIAGPTLSVPEVADVALARGGEDLIVIARHAIYVADPDDLSATPRTVWTRAPSSSYTPALNAISINDQGAALISQTYHFAGVSGHTALLHFDALRFLMLGSATGFNTIYEAQLSRSPGGRYSVVSGHGLSPPPPTLIFDSYTAGATLLGSYSEISTSSHYPTREIDHAGTRMLEGSYQVRNIQGSLLGTLGAFPYSQPYQYAMLSPDGTRSFKYTAAPMGPGSIEVQDLTGTPTPDFPVLGTVPSPARVVDPNQYPFIYPGATYYLNGLITPDGNFMILAGPERIVVVDVSGF